MVMRLSGRLSTTTTAAAPAFWAFSTFTVNAHGWETPEASGGPAHGGEGVSTSSGETRGVGGRDSCCQVP
jgi:hypothetical protein